MELKFRPWVHSKSTVQTLTSRARPFSAWNTSSMVWLSTSNLGAIH